jgi:hypothetical protein
MKYLLIIMVLFFVGCSSGPNFIRVKNCNPLGSNLWDCEEIPEHNVERVK